MLTESHVITWTLIGLVVAWRVQPEGTDSVNAQGAVGRVV